MLFLKNRNKKIKQKNKKNNNIGCYKYNFLYIFKEIYNEVSTLNFDKKICENKKNVCIKKINNR